MNNQTHVLSVNDVTMQFGGVVAVNNLNMHIDKSEIVALIGPNGAGKTTAFNVITGVYQPTNGNVMLNGEVIAAGYPSLNNKLDYCGINEGKYTEKVTLSPDKITYKGIARTFQNIRLFKNLSVLDNVRIAKHMRMKANLFTDTFMFAHKEETQIKADCEELLKLVDLYEQRNEVANALPYGKQRYLEIARALATNPSLLLLDEPAAGMNPQETDELADFIRKIQDQFDLTIFLIEHHMDLVMDISDRIYVVDFGRLIASGTPADIQENQDVIDAYLGVTDDE